MNVGVEISFPVRCSSSDPATKRNVNKAADTVLDLRLINSQKHYFYYIFPQNCTSQYCSATLISSMYANWVGGNQLFKASMWKYILKQCEELLQTSAILQPDGVGPTNLTIGCEARQRWWSIIESARQNWMVKKKFLNKKHHKCA